jgi:hypothetical protein
MMPRPAVVVWGLWTTMLLLALFYVARYGANAPYYDEWSMVAVLEDTRSVDAAWLWMPHNDHRIPLPKLALLGLYGISGWNFRAAMFANVLLVAAAAALLMRSAAWRRGRTAYTDCVFPLILLHWGHYQNFLWGWQVTQVIPVALVLAILGTMVRAGLRPGSASALACGLAVVALPLSGVPGLAYTPALAAWLVLVGWLRWPGGAPGGRPLALALWGCAAFALLLVPLYFLGLTTSVHGMPELVPALGTMGAFLSQGFSPAPLVFRPYSLVLLVLTMGLILTMGLSGLAMLLPALLRQEAATRERAVALLLFLAGLASLALSVGIARPGFGTFPPRYYLQAVPAIAWLYFAWDIFGRPKIAAVLRAVLTALALAALVLNNAIGLEYARTRTAAFAAFSEDLRQGLPPSTLIARHQRTLLPFPEGGGAYWHLGLARSLNTLRRAGIGVFGDLTPEGPLREVPIAALATAQADGSATLWHFDSPVHLLGLRLIPPRSRTGEEIGPYTTVAWRPAAAEFTPNRRYHHWWYQGEPEARIWIDDTVQALRIEIDDPASDFKNPGRELRPKGDPEPVRVDDFDPSKIVLLFAEEAALAAP